MVLFFQLDLLEEFGLPFTPRSHLSIFMCPFHNDAPESAGPERLPDRYWEHRSMIGGPESHYQAKRPSPMRYIAALALSVLIPASGLAYSPKQPTHHKRYSPNYKYFVDFNPESNRHTIYAADSPDAPLWSIESDAFWPYKHDESDGCLFVAGDGSSVAGPTWVHRTGGPPDHRVFDGLEFWNRKGQLAAYRVSELPSWRLKILDFPVRIVWIAIHGPEHRGRNVTRHGDELHVTTFGMRSFTFSLQTGEIMRSNLNTNYFAYFVVVYAVPLGLLVRWIVRRWRGLAASRTEQKQSHGILISNVGSALVLLNSLGFAFGVLLDSFFGGTIDQIGAQFCTFTYPIAFVLVPVTFVMSAAGLASHPRRFDVLGPWLAIMSVVVLVAVAR